MSDKRTFKHSKIALHISENRKLLIFNNEEKTFVFQKHSSRKSLSHSYYIKSFFPLQQYSNHFKKCHLKIIEF